MSPESSPRSDPPDTVSSHAYLSLSDNDRRAMLQTLGVEAFEDLESDIPDVLKGEFEPRGGPRDEQEVWEWHRRVSSRNRSVDELSCFLGGGLYDHHVPRTVLALMNREEFLTSYTPYQAEMNQGLLQGMFEYQSMISSLMALPVTNASMYDGATAFAEAVLMAVNTTDRERIVYSPTLFDSWIGVLRAYAEPFDWELESLPTVEGRAVFPEDWGSQPPAAVCMAYPNRWGCSDAVAQWEQRRPDDQTVGIAAVNPLAMGILKPPGELGWDVAVGEGQPLGLPLQFGAPQLGLFSARERFLRQMPGRLVGETEDRRGRRCYVLTLQTREQHIRRERATSNICTNHALLTLGIAVALATLGPQGLHERARTNHGRGQLLREAFETRGIDVLGTPVFNEVTCVGLDPGGRESLAEQLGEVGFVGGYWNEGRYVCAATERRSADEIETFAGEVADRVRT